MRAKLVKDRRNGAQTMTVHTTRGESLDLGQAQWLAQGHWYMLPFRYESNDAETLLYYDVTNCVPLHKHLHQALPAGQFTGALLAVLSVMEQCESQRIPLNYIDWDSKQIFMAPQGYPLFMVTPIVGLESNRETPAMLLKLLADARKTKVADPAEQRQQTMLYGFVQQTPVVSPAVFHGFLAMALPGMVQPRAVGAQQTQQAQHSTAADSAQRMEPHAANNQAHGAGYVAQNVENVEDPMSETQFGQTVVAGTAQFDAIRSTASGTANGTAATDDATQLGARNDATLINSSQPVDNQQINQQPTHQVTTDSSGTEDDEDGGTVLSTLLKRRTDAHPSPVAPSPETPSLATPLPQRAETQKPQPLRPQPQLAQQSQPIEQPAAQPIAQSQPIMATQPSQPIQEPIEEQQTQARPTQQPIAQPAVDLPEDSEGETILRPSASKVSGFTVTRLRDNKTVTVYAEHATIGRSKTADIHMGGNTNVSRVHAIIDMLDDGRFSITDNHSANGTAVEGRELADGGREYLPSGGDFTLADDTFVVTLLHR